MSMAGSNYMLNVAKTQYRLMLPISILPTILFLILSPVVISIQNLDSASAAFALERFFSIAGVLLLTPLSQPEQNKAIRETVAGKKISNRAVMSLRLVLLTFLLPLFILGVCKVMKLSGSTFPFWQYAFGGFATAYVLGVLGFLAGNVSDNWVIGYLVPLGYYIINWGGGSKLKQFYLFSMASGSMTEKYVLFFAGIILCISTLLYQYVKGKFVGEI